MMTIINYGEKENITQPNNSLTIREMEELSRINEELIRKYNTIKKLQEENNRARISEIKLTKQEVDLLEVIEVQLHNQNEFAQAIRTRYNEINSKLGESKGYMTNIVDGFKIGDMYQSKFLAGIRSVTTQFSILNKLKGIPFLGEAASMTTSGVEKFAGGLGKTIDVFKALTGSARGFFAVLGIGLKSIGIGLIVSAVAGLMQIFSIVKRFNIGGISSSLGKLSSLIGVLSNKLMLMIANITQKFSPIIRGVFEGIEQVIVSIFNLISGYSTSFMDGLAMGFGNINKLGDNFREIFVSIGNIIKGLTPAIEVLAKVLGFVLGTAINLIIEPIKWLVKALEFIFGSVKDINAEAKTMNTSNSSINFAPIYTVNSYGGANTKELDRIREEDYTRARTWLTTR